MKTTTMRLALCLPLCAALFAACKKNNPDPSATTQTYTSINDVFSQLRTQPKTITIDAGTGGSFYGATGTRYIIAANSLQTAAGTSATGSVTMQVSEYLQKGDMIFSRLLPISNGEPLLSGGEISITATQGGQQLYLKPHTYFTANIPTPGGAPTGMSLFTAQPAADTTFATTNWILPVRDSTHLNTGAFPGLDTLGILGDSLGLCNADQFMASPSYQDFLINVTATGATISATDVVYCYALYDNYKGVWPQYKYTPATQQFHEMHVPNIPVHFVAFCLLGGRFYATILGATPATGSTYSINLTQADPVAFKAQVNQL